VLPPEFEPGSVARTLLYTFTSENLSRSCLQQIYWKSWFQSFLASFNDLQTYSAFYLFQNQEKKKMGERRKKKMDRKIPTFFFILLMSITLVISNASMTKTIAQPNPDMFVNLTTSSPVTTDPSWAQDDASAQLLLNVYQCLMDFEFAHTNRFVGEIAEYWLGYNETLGNV
jgi:hypothetical protein